jgi:hypothetical protein
MVSESWFPALETCIERGVTRTRIKKSFLSIRFFWGSKITINPKKKKDDNKFTSDQ